MESHVADMISGNAFETVFFLQHPPLYTMGTSADLNDVLDQTLPVFESPRGGKMTYHGPGQLIIYVMMDLHPRAKDIKKYITALEQWGILTLQQFGIDAGIRHDRVGLWVNEALNQHVTMPNGLRSEFLNEDQNTTPIPHTGDIGSDALIPPQESKIAAIGVRLKKWRTYHGMSINVHPNLDHFKGIIPCGLSEFGVTSMKHMGIETTIESVVEVMKKTYPQIGFFNDFKNA